MNVPIVRCTCGRTYRPRPEHVGRSIRCRCGRVVPIPTAPAGGAAGPWRPSARFRRWLRVAGWAWIVSVCLLTGLLWGLADRWWLATLFLYGPRWPAAVPCVLLVLLAGVGERRLLVPLAAGLLVCLGPLMGGRSGWRALAGRPDGTPVRVVSFNMRGAQNPQWQDVPLRLLGLQPDLVLVQECVAGLEAAVPRLDGWTVRRDANLCLLTRFPVDSTSLIDVVRTREDGTSGLAAVHHLRVGERSVTVANVHLETPRHGIERVRWGGEITALSRNLLVRDAGSRRIARWVQAQSDDLLAGGDFNLPVESRIYREHWGWCGNAFSRRGHGFGFTRVLPKWSVRIDHVLTCGRSWTAVAARPGPDLGSDHLPLVVDLVLRPAVAGP